MTRKALGKGLGALIGSQALADPKPREQLGESVQRIPLAQIVPSPLQPRKHFAAEQLTELSDSIRAKGILSPLIVRKVDGKYELIAGERRWRASQEAGLAVAPVIVRQATDRDVLELALIENLQRADLDPIDEAEGYGQLIERFKITQEEVARQVGKSRAAVANALRLRALPKEIKAMLTHGQLSVGHAKVILGLESSEQQSLAAHEAVKRGLNVRETEKLVQGMLSPRQGGKGGAARKKSEQADWRDLEQRMQRAIGTKVRLVGTHDSGHVELNYYNSADLERILDKLGVKMD